MQDAYDRYRILVFSALFTLIYLPVFHSDYAYLDEIFQLWHQKDSANYDMFFTQGRWLTGVIFKYSFSLIDSISDIKYLRIFSMAGWLLTSLLWSHLFRKWLKWINYDRQLAWVADLFAICSVSVCVYIGWASCMEVFLAIAFGLMSGHLFFAEMQKPGRVRKAAITASFLLGLLALFTYQPGFGMFLLPFFLQYTAARRSRPLAALEKAVIFYLIVYAVYFFLFKYSLQWAGMVASDRTRINFSVAKKLAFFFSGPLPSGFCLNILYRGSGVLCQAVYGATGLYWIYSIFRKSGEPAISRIVYILTTFILLAIIYLPSMIASENFASYRTLFVFNLAVFLMVAGSILNLTPIQRKKNLVAIACSVFLVITDIYAFRFQFVHPLTREYAAVRGYLDRHYNISVKSVHFARADSKLFGSVFGTHDFKDEFGAPSTSRDWVPEPLMKQFIFEKTGNRELAVRTNLVQYTSPDSIPPVTRHDSTALLLDVNSILHRY